MCCWAIKPPTRRRLPAIAPLTQPCAANLAPFVGHARCWLQLSEGVVPDLAGGNAADGVAHISQDGERETLRPVMQGTARSDHLAIFIARHCRHRRAD